MLWQTYRLKHREGKTIRSAQEESAYIISPLRLILTSPRSGTATLLDMPKIRMVSHNPQTSTLHTIN